MHLDLDLEKIPGALETVLGLPHLRWPTAERWVTGQVPPAARREARGKLAEQWLRLLGLALGPPYGTCQSDRFLALGPRDGPLVPRLLEEAERIVSAIGEALGPQLCLAEAARPGPRVLVLLALEDYYTYVSRYYGDGHYATSGGMFFAEGYPHLALWGRDLRVLVPALSHELVHDALGHLPLPPWLNEGITQMLESHLAGTPKLDVSSETARRHRRLWRRIGLLAFWSGESFHSARAGEQAASYELAEILARNLAAEHGPAFFDFVAEARAGDAGRAAADRVLGRSLGECAAAFLGPGDWEPPLALPP